MILQSVESRLKECIEDRLHLNYVIDVRHVLQ